MKYFYFFSLSIMMLSACHIKKHADLIVKNAKVYTVDSNFTIAEAFAVSDGKIVATGTSKDILNDFIANEVIDAEGKAVYPGFIDAHTHFYRYGQGLQNVDLVGTKSWEEVVEKVKAFADENPEGWIIGRGWDQNDWANENFPEKSKLDSLFKNRPVILHRVDGHAAVVNQVALDAAGIVPGQTLVGGEIETKNGKLTGILVDNAVDLVTAKIPPLSRKQTEKGLLAAAQNCFAVGLTTVDDCGLDYEDALLIDSLQKSGDLKMRTFVMLSDAKKNFDFLFKRGKIKTNFMNIRSFKVYADGALGSRGACLLKPYADMPGHYGFLLSSPQHFEDVAQEIHDHGFQMCTHAIGDSANRLMLKIYASVLKGKNDERWRIEHAQVIAPEDFKLFGEYNVIPSVQPTHTTSDMYWTAQRLGNERVKSAYAYQQLLQENGWIPLGTDFPVEDINPMYTFSSAVTRQDLAHFPPNGFQKDNALSREQALRGMTIWAAKANFEEKEKGSLEPEKLADFVILDQDLMKAPDKDLAQIKVSATYIEGKCVYKK